MDSQTDRGRSMPLFLLASMVMHALLFLYVPKIISGTFPSTQPGDQGGLTYVTIVDIPLTERPRAAVDDAVRRPQSRPTPVPRPTPVASASAAPDPVPQSVVPVETQPRPVTQPTRPTSPEPALTIPQSNIAVAEAGSDQTRTTAEQEQETSSAETTPSREDAVAAVPDAQIDPEPQLPPTGESMIRSFGGSTFPKNAVGLVRGSVTVEVAAIVAAEGNLIDVIVVEGSGIAAVDSHAANVVRHLIQFRPYDDVYEMRVFITFDSQDQDRLHFQYSEFIRSPPALGPH